MVVVHTSFFFCSTARWDLLGDCGEVECWSFWHWIGRGVGGGMVVLFFIAGSLGFYTQQSRWDRLSRPAIPWAFKAAPGLTGASPTDIARGGTNVGGLLIRPRPIVLWAITAAKACVCWSATIVARRDPELATLGSACVVTLAALCVCFVPQSFFFHQIRHLAKYVHANGAVGGGSCALLTCVMTAFVRGAYMFAALVCWIVYAGFLLSDTDLDLVGLIGLSEDSAAASYLTPGVPTALAGCWVLCFLICFGISFCARGKRVPGRNKGFFLANKVIDGVVTLNERAVAESKNAVVGEYVHGDACATCCVASVLIC